MKKESNKEETGNEPVVIADECGDSMWDAVLQQEVKAPEVQIFLNMQLPRSKELSTAQVTDTTRAKPLV